MNRLNDTDWCSILQELREHRIPSGVVHKAIVRLGKPYDAKRIEAAKDAVAMYLRDDDAWVRHEALWFLTTWGRLSEYKPQATEMMLHDACDDNRAFAARCLGILQAGSSDDETLNVLRYVVLDDSACESVRVAAFASMLRVMRVAMSPAKQFDLDVGLAHLNDIDWNWVASVSSESR